MGLSSAIAKRHHVYCRLWSPFKSLCDHLTAISYPVDEHDKSHWFLCGLGQSFETLSIAQHAIKSRPSFSDLLAQAEGHDFFLKAMHGLSTPQASFFTDKSQGSSNTSSGHGSSSNRSKHVIGRCGYLGGRGHGHRSPHF